MILGLTEVMESPAWESVNESIGPKITKAMGTLKDMKTKISMVMIDPSNNALPDGITDLRSFASRTMNVKNTVDLATSTCKLMEKQMKAK